jgi:pyruvate ferredoxin oxidoreductase alpha subunit
VSRIAVDRLRKTGVAAGLMKIRMLRPSPKDSWRRALGGASRVVVIDRNLTAGAGGVFADEIRNALYAAGDRPGVFAAVAGLGGRDVTPEDVCGIVRAALDSDAEDAPPIYWGLKE